MPFDKRFIQKIELLNNENDYNYDASTNTVTFKIKIYRDEDFINSYISSQKLSAKLDFRLYYDHAVKINGFDSYLENVYKGIPVTTELNPTLDVVENIAKAEKDGDSYIFKFSGLVNTLQGQNIIHKPKIFDVVNISQQTISSFKDRIKSSTIFNVKTNNLFDFLIKIPTTMKVFSTNQRRLDMELVVQFQDSKNISYNRKIPVTLLAHEEQIISNNSLTPIVFNSSVEMINALDDSAVLTDGTIIKDLKSKYQTSADGFNTNGFIQDFTPKSEMVISPDSKYHLKSGYVDIDKLKKAVTN